jgi:hypothetical protein
LTSNLVIFFFPFLFWLPFFSPFTCCENTGHLTSLGLIFLIKERKKKIERIKRWGSSFKVFFFSQIVFILHLHFLTILIIFFYFLLFPLFLFLFIVRFLYYNVPLLTFKRALSHTLSQGSKSRLLLFTFCR